MRKKISVLEITVELHTSIAYLSLYSSLKRIMDTPSNVYSIYNPQCLRVNLGICMLTLYNAYAGRTCSLTNGNEQVIVTMLFCS